MASIPRIPTQRRNGLENDKQIAISTRAVYGRACWRKTSIFFRRVHCKKTQHVYVRKVDEYIKDDRKRLYFFRIRPEYFACRLQVKAYYSKFANDYLAVKYVNNTRLSPWRERLLLDLFSEMDHLRCPFQQERHSAWINWIIISTEAKFSRWGSLLKKIQK